MMKQPTAVRDRVARRVLDMLEHLRVQLSMLPDTELDVLKLLERPQQFDLGVELTDFVMGKFGAPVHEYKDPRFNPTRRAMAKRRLKGPRGTRVKIKGLQEPTMAEAAPKAESL